MQGQSHARERNVLQTDPESIPLAMVRTYPIAINFQSFNPGLNVLYPSDEQATSKVSIKLE